MQAGAAHHSSTTTIWLIRASGACALAATGRVDPEVQAKSAALPHPHRRSSLEMSPSRVKRLVQRHASMNSMTATVLPRAIRRGGAGRRSGGCLTALSRGTARAVSGDAPLAVASAFGIFARAPRASDGIPGTCGCRRPSELLMRPPITQRQCGCFAAISRTRCTSCPRY